MCSSRSTDFQLTTCTGRSPVAQKSRPRKTCGGEATLWISYVREILVEHVHSPCLLFRELTVPWLLNGATIERIACVTQSTELGGDAENGLLLRFRLQQADKHRKDGVSFHRFTRNKEFRRRLLGGALRLQSLPETAKICRKYTNNGEWTIHRRGKEAQVAKNKRFPLTCCRGRHLEGAWSCSKSLSKPSRTSNWRKMRANSGKSTATVVDLRAVVRRWVNFLHALDIIKTTDAVLSSIPREALSALTPECLPRWRSRRIQVPVWIAFVFTGLSFSCSCVCFIHRIVLCFLSWLCLRSDFITLRSRKNGNKIVARRQWRSATAFRSHHYTRKMVLQKPVGTTRLENAENFRKVRKTTFSRSPPGQSLCQWRQKGASRPNSGGVAADFHDAQLENQTSDRLRIGGNLLVTNSSIDCESFISGLSSPLNYLSIYLSVSPARSAESSTVSMPPCWTGWDAERHSRF